MRSLTTATIAAILATGPAGAGISFVSETTVVTPAGVADVVLADLNGDHALDVALLEGQFGFPGTAFLEVLLNNGDGSFAEPVAMVVGTYGALEFFVDELRAGDLDGDGDLDLAFVGTIAPLTLLFNDGGGTFGMPVETDITVDFAFLNALLAIGDLNGDDVADAVVGPPGRLAFNDGSGAPRPGDVDGDGDVDISDFLTLLGTWGPCPAPCPPGCPADFDGDCEVGITDFLILLGNFD